MAAWNQLALAVLETHGRWRLSMHRCARHLTGQAVTPPWADGEDARALEAHRLALCAMETAAALARADLPPVEQAPEKVAGHLPEPWRTGA